MEALAIFIGGGLGSLTRWGIGRWVGSRGGSFPWGTLLANVLACILLGFLVAYFLKRAHFPKAIQLGAMVGFCGGFSTFSTFSAESWTLFEGGKWDIGLGYVAASLVLGLGGLLLGHFVASLLN